MIVEKINYKTRPVTFIRDLKPRVVLSCFMTGGTDIVLCGSDCWWNLSP